MSSRFSVVSKNKFSHYKDAQTFLKLFWGNWVKLGFDKEDFEGLHPNRNHAHIVKTLSDGNYELWIDFGREEDYD